MEPAGNRAFAPPPRVAAASLELDSPTAERVGWDFIALYTLAFMSTSLLFLAPLLVTLALKVNSLVGIQQAPSSLALVAGTGALLAMFGNPIVGKMSDRTSSPLGMRRPWMVIGLAGGSLGILIVALAPDITILLVGWCIAQLLFNALLAAVVAVLPDQVPIGQRGLISGILGVGMPIASVSATFLVNLFTGNQLAMFLVPCAIAGCFILVFVATLKDRRLAREDKPAWSVREIASTFYVNPRKSPDFAWAFASRLMFVLAYAFLVTYQAYYLLEKIGSTVNEVPQQIFLGTLAQSAVLIAAALTGGRLSDRTGRREDLRFFRVDRVWPGAVRGRHRQQLQRFPRWPGDQRARFRGLPGRRPCACCRCSAEPGHRREGSRRVQHRRRSSIFDRAIARAHHPGYRWRQLRRAVRVRGGLRHHRSGRRASRKARPLTPPPQ